MDNDIVEGIDLFDIKVQSAVFVFRFIVAAQNLVLSFIAEEALGDIKTFLLLSNAYSKQDQVNNADSAIIFLINHWSVRIVKVVWSVRVVEVVQDVQIIQVVQLDQVVRGQWSVGRPTGS